VSGRDSLHLVGVLLALPLIACSTSGDGVPLPNLQGVEEPVADAVERARAAVIEAPSSAKAWGKLGDRLRLHNWSAEAAFCYRKAEALEPDEFMWPYLLGHALAASDPRGAALAFATAVEHDASYAPARIHYARVLVRMGRAEEARQQFEAAGRIDPRLPQSWIGLGQLALADGDYPTARTRLEEAMSLNPRNGQIHRALAQTYLGLGNPKRAEFHGERAAALPGTIKLPDPRLEQADSEMSIGSVAHNRAGRQLERQGRLDEAAEHYRKAIEIRPEIPEPRVNLGMILAQQGQLEDAIAQYQEALGIHPEFADAWFRLGRAQERLGRLKQATDAYRETLRINPDHGEAHYRLGSVLAGEGLSVEAATHLAEAARILPGRAAIHMNLGIALARQGKFEPAVENLSIAVRIDADNADAHYNLGAILAELGQPEPAARHFREVLRIRPQDVQAAHALSQVTGGG